MILFNIFHNNKAAKLIKHKDKFKLILFFKMKIKLM